MAEFFVELLPESQNIHDTRLLLYTRLLKRRYFLIPLTLIKKITTLLFAIVFIYSYLLYYASFYVQLSRIKSNVKDSRQSGHYVGENMKTFTFSQKDKSKVNNLTWIDENEFLYENQLYDVYARSEDKDSIHFYCKVDQEENELFFELEKHVKLFITTDSSSDHKEIKHKILIKDFICQPLIDTDFFYSHTIIYQNELCLFHLSWYSLVESPPPTIFYSNIVYSC